MKKDRCLLEEFFTDNQAAVAFNMTLRSLRNKIYREKMSGKRTLPAHHAAVSRGRLWEISSVRKYLEDTLKLDDEVNERIRLGAHADPMGTDGAKKE